MILTNNSVMTLTLDLETWLRSMHTFYPMARLGQQERKYAPDEILDGKMDELTIACSQNGALVITFVKQTYYC